VEQVFGWIGQIFQTLLKLLPWLVIVPATHGGVAFVHGHRIKEWKPGLLVLACGYDLQADGDRAADADDQAKWR
jgi:hypothetical protein